MNGQIFYAAGHTDALKHAVMQLRQKGFIFASAPDNSVTHLLLGVPSFQSDGFLHGGGSIEKILSALSDNVIVFGGNLDHPALAGYQTVDLLKNPLYLAENANITAHCAVKQAITRLPVTLHQCQVLVVGWGRIGKCLAALLKQMGAIVTVAARKESDRSVLSALGYETEDSNNLGYSLLRYRVIFNTVPTMVIPRQTAEYCHENCLKIDLASKPGIEGEDVIWARGLPNKDTPETSGTLIANTILRQLR